MIKKRSNKKENKKPIGKNPIRNVELVHDETGCTSCSSSAAEQICAIWHVGRGINFPLERTQFEESVHNTWRRKRASGTEW